MSAPMTQTIQLNADGPLASEMPRNLAAAIRRAREGGVTLLLDGKDCVARIVPGVQTLAETIPETQLGSETARDHSDFRGDLASLINAYSLENVSNTPDFVLAQLLHECLVAFDKATITRDHWYGVKLSPGGSHFVDAAGQRPPVISPELAVELNRLRGRWVAIIDQRIVADGNSAEEAVTRCATAVPGHAGMTDPLIFRVPQRDLAHFLGIGVEP